jgi:hypothetical protein
MHAGSRLFNECGYGWVAVIAHGLQQGLEIHGPEKGVWTRVHPGPDMHVVRQYTAGSKSPVYLGA